jgi:hypothetical protein
MTKKDFPNIFFNQTNHLYIYIYFFFRQFFLYKSFYFYFSKKKKKMNYGLINCKIVESCFKAGGTLIINEEVAKKVLEILDKDEQLTLEEKSEAKKDIIRGLDTYNLKEINEFKYECIKCNLKGRTNLNCEHCVRKILKKNFNNWSSGFFPLDKTIQNAQIDYPLPGHFPEWIPYNDLNEIKKKTQGGFATIFTAKWKKGKIITFSPDSNSFQRTGPIPVILKRLPDSYMYDEKSFNEVLQEILFFFLVERSILFCN